MADIARIKGNIQKMIAQGAPEADIDAYVGAEGVTAAELRGQAPESTASDIMKSADAGVAKGIAMIGGAPGDLTDLGARGIHAATNWVERKLGFPETPMPDRSNSILNKLPTSKSMEAAIQRDFYNGEKPYEAQTKPGKVAEAIGEFAPSAVAGPGGLIVKALTAAGGGVGKVYGGDAAASVFGEEARPYGEFAGSVVGGVSPATGARVITPNAISPARQRLLDTLEQNGVTSLTAGQRTGNKGLMYMEDAMGNAPGSGSRASQITREGQEQFTDAALRRAGAAGEATPEVLARNNQRLGDNFSDLAARNNLVPDNQFITDMTGAVQRYRNVPNSQQAQMVQGYIDDIIPHVNAGQMTGPEYQAMRSRLTRQANNTRQTDPDLSDVLRDMRNALDNAMERSIPASSPDAALWRQTRREYAAQKDIEKAASRAGEATAEGQIVPANLRNVVSANNRGAYARGEGEFSELARAGSGIMAPLPNSGTAQRYNALNLLNQATMGAVPALGGRALMSTPMQRYLANQILGRQMDNLPRSREAILRALITQDKTKLLEGPSN